MVTYAAAFRFGDARAQEMSEKDVVEMAIAIWVMVGVMVCTVAGVGLFMDELRSGLYTFWRSRPISVGRWFTTKFRAGLLITTLTLSAPVMLAGFYWLAFKKEPLPGAELSARYLAEAVAIGLIPQAAVFSVAVASIVLLRRPIHAVVTALSVTYLGGISIVLVGNLFGDLWGVESGMAAIAVGLLEVFGVVWLSWMAVKKDWGWKN